LVDLVVEHAATGREYYRELWWQDAEPRRWLGGTSTPVDAVGRLPSDAPTGAYKILLSFPDSWRSLYSDGRYSIRLANKETTWESAKGYNDLGLYFVLQGAAVSPNYSVPKFIPR
jgi:uncharacterized protein DUF4832